MGFRNHITFQDWSCDHQRLSNELSRVFVIWWKFGNCKECRLLGLTMRLKFHLFYDKLLLHYINTSKHFLNKLELKYKLFPTFNGQCSLYVKMASRLIECQIMTLDNNVSCEMSFILVPLLWVRRVSFFLTFVSMSAISVRWL